MFNSNQLLISTIYMQVIFINTMINVHKTGYMSESWATPTPPLATVITSVSLGMHMDPAGHAPLYRLCDRKLFYACAWNGGARSGHAWCGPGSTLGITRIPRHAQCATNDPRKGGVASLGRVTWNPI